MFKGSEITGVYDPMCAGFSFQEWVSKVSKDFARKKGWSQPTNKADIIMI